MAQLPQTGRFTGGRVDYPQDGQPRCGILCPEDPTLQDKKAAQELQHWFKGITGATINIYYGGAPGKNIILRTDPALAGAKTKRPDPILFGTGFASLFFVFFGTRLASPFQ